MHQRWHWVDGPSYSTDVDSAVWIGGQEYECQTECNNKFSTSRWTVDFFNTATTAEGKPYTACVDECALLFNASFLTDDLPLAKEHPRYVEGHPIRVCSLCQLDKVPSGDAFEGRCSNFCGFSVDNGWTGKGARAPPWAPGWPGVPARQDSCVMVGNTKASWGDTVNWRSGPCMWDEMEPPGESGYDKAGW